MRFITAVNAMAAGTSVISDVSEKRYTADMIPMITYGAHWAIFHTDVNAVITKEERKGTFKLTEVNG